MKKISKYILKKIGYKVVSEHAYAMDVRQMRNFLYYSHLYSMIKNIDGSIVECGVGKGRSLLYFSFLAMQENTGRRIYGFDSFEGFPEPMEEDSSYRQPKKGEWSGISPDDIRETLRVAGISNDFIEKNIKLIPGFFNKTLDRYNDGPIALLHVDADLYESYKDVLTMLYPKVKEGGIVLFDEYRTEEWPGATKAVDDYFKDRVKDIKFDASVKKYYLIK